MPIVCSVFLLCVSAGCVGSNVHKAENTASVSIDPIYEIKQSNSELIANAPDVAQIKFKKISRSLFSFYRGTSPLFYRYCRSHGVSDALVSGATEKIQLHGDYHIENCGAYKSEDGLVSFDLMDFDDTFKGPYILDIRRAAVSLRIVCEQKGWETKADEVVSHFVSSYSDTIGGIESQSISVDFSYKKGTSVALIREIIDGVENITRKSFFSKTGFTRINESGKRIFIKSKTLLEVPQYVHIEKAMSEYIRTLDKNARKESTFYAIKDVVLDRKSGIGSAGKMKYLILIEGVSMSPDDDVILEMKQEDSPEWAGEYGDSYTNNGKRVYNGQSEMQSLSYPCIGYTTIQNKNYFVSEFTPFYAELETKEINSYQDILSIAEVTATLIAKGHVRASQNRKTIMKDILKVSESGNLKKDIMNFSKKCFFFFESSYDKFKKRLKEYPLL